METWWIEVDEVGGSVPKIKKYFGEESFELITQRITIMRFLKLKEVMALTALGRSSIYKFMEENRFPKSVSLGDRAVAWVESEVEEWMHERLSQRDEKQA